MDLFLDFLLHDLHYLHPILSAGLELLVFGTVAVVICLMYDLVCFLLRLLSDAFSRAVSRFRLSRTARMPS